MPVLGGDVGQRCRELLRETARAHEMVVHAGSINRDHVHLLLSIPPSLSVSRAVQYLKGRSSHKLLSEFGKPAQALLGPASMGPRLLGCEQRQRDRRGLGRVHQEPDPARTRRQLQCDLRSAEWRTDPALSRNLKPPPFRRWSVHKYLPEAPSLCGPNQCCWGLRCKRCHCAGAWFLSSRTINAGAMVLSACTLDRALHLVEHAGLSAAVLDYGLADNDCGSLCERLQERRIPFVIYSGYRIVKDKFQDAVIIPKPAALSDVVEAVSALLRAPFIRRPSWRGADHART